MRKRAHRRSNRLKGIPLRLAGALGLILALSSLGAAPAWGGYEQVADFGENELWRATGLAVNVTGAGGVEAGSVYAVSESSRRVARYSPDGEFREAWGWGVDNGAAEYQRCGPEGEVAHPTCKPPFDPLPTGEGAGQFWSPYGVAVEQSTGRVYVLDGSRKNGVVQVLSADGTEVLGSFGERGAFGESFDEGPGRIHNVRPAGIAVRNGGVAYVTDWKPPSAASGAEERVMVFEDGVYAGRDHDIAASPPAPAFKYTPFGLATDDANNLYVMGEDKIFAFSPADRLNPSCEYDFSAGGLHSMTVDPTSGAPFFFSNKGKKEIHQLSPCNGEGEFEEVGTIAVSPQTTKLDALAFNPSLSYGPGRPPGTLYGADGEERSPQKGIGHIFAGAEAFPPVVESEAVSSVTSSSAILSAQIDPKGFETRYAFQYLTAAQYEANEPADRFAGATEVPVGGALLGRGSETLSASSAIVGLLPDTEYRYRAVATSHCQDGNPAAICEGIGEAESFRTFPAEAPGLPDNRAYELVSPAFKNGGEVFPLTPERASCGIECKPGAATQPFPRLSSPDGEAVVYEGQPFSLTEGATVYNQYLSRRTPTGWQTTTLAPKLMGSTREGYKAFAADLSTGILLQGKPSLTPEAPSETNNLYTQLTATPGALTPLLGATPPNRGSDIKLAYAGSSADFSRHFFAADDALTGPTPFAPEALDGGTSKMNLYEWAGGELRLVNVLPNAEALPGAHFGAPALFANNYSNSVSDLSHAISDDGSRVFWSDEAGQVYVREDGETTTEIPDPGKFLTAAADGSKVLLRNGHLYDLQTEAITDLTEGQGGFEGIAGQSEDLSRVYFVATSVLSGEEENDHGAKAEAGKPNLYAWQEGSLAFLATLLAVDDIFDSGGTWNFSPAQRTALASPDGRWLAFLSRAPLTGYDNVGPACERKQSGELLTAPCREVFLYDSANDELRCPSCNPTNQAPLGPSGLQPMEQSGGREDPVAPARYLTDEGRLYFDSQDSLSTFDTNDRVEDVYQYQPQGVGTCKRAGGCVNLISAGTGIVDSNFLAVDETGENVFFTSRDQLLLRDRDELLDLYVAREDGGIPAETEVARGECQGEACLPAVSLPNDPALASSVFQGPGNVEEKKAAKKKKLKKRCRSTNRAIAEFTGHNGKLYAFKPLLKAKCPKARKGKAKAKPKPKPQGRR